MPVAVASGLLTLLLQSGESSLPPKTRGPQGGRCRDRLALRLPTRSRGVAVSSPRVSHGWKPPGRGPRWPRRLPRCASRGGPAWRPLTQRAPPHSQSRRGAAGRQGWWSPPRVRRWRRPRRGSGPPRRGLEPPAGVWGAEQATWTLCGPQRPWWKALEQQEPRERREVERRLLGGREAPVRAPRGAGGRPGPPSGSGTRSAGRTRCSSGRAGGSGARAAAAGLPGAPGRSCRRRGPGALCGGSGPRLQERAAPACPPGHLERGAEGHSGSPTAEVALGAGRGPGLRPPEPPVPGRTSGEEGGSSQRPCLTLAVPS